MTIEALVAEALHSIDEGSDGEYEWSVTGTIEETATAILATPAGQTLARWAAIGEAVERLAGHAVLKRKPDGRWHAYLYDYEPMMPHGWETAMARPTITDAINAALGDEG